MTTVDLTITYDKDRGEPADVGTVLRRLGDAGTLNLSQLTIGISLNGEADALPFDMTTGLMGRLTDLPVGANGSLKLTIKRDKLAKADAVGLALLQLAAGPEPLPLTEIKFSILVRDEAAAELLIADLEELLADRPASVDVEFEKVVPGGFRRGQFERRLPMLDALRRIEQSDGAGAVLQEFARRRGVERVELSSGGRTVVLTEQTRHNAEQALRRAGMGDE